ncbi:MAG: EAL domain-containing protein [Coprococcus sp.]
MNNNLVEEFSYDTKLLYDALVRSTDEFIYICNMKTGVYRYPSVMVKEFHFPGELLRDPFPYWKEVVHPEDWEHFYLSNKELGKEGRDNHLVEFRVKSRDGEYRWMKCRGYLMRDENNEPAVFAGVLSKLDRKPRIDALTSLYTSEVFLEDFTKMLEENVFGEIGMFILGIDTFRNINEAYGRQTGDKVLKTVAKLILELVPEGIRVYRLEGDHFGILVKYPNEEMVKKLYDAIRSRSQCYRGNGKRRLLMTVSAGYAEYPKDAGSFVDLYEYADYALQYAKENGRDCLQLFSQEMLAYRSRELDILRLLKEDISDNFRAFSLKYQPIVEGETKEVIAVEALLQWENPQIANLEYDEFSKFLEKNRLLNPVGRWMFQTGCMALKKWMSEGWNLALNLNVSYAQLSDWNYIQEIIMIVKNSRVPPEKIVIEVVDSYFISDMKIYEQVRAIKESGMKIMLDDFGADYASIGLLKNNLVDIVKVDRTIVRRVVNSSFDLDFIRFIVKICHDMEIEVCLEGVAEMEELKLVEDMIFDYMQGDLFGKATDARLTFK